MCGILGIISKAKTINRVVFKEMVLTLQHRGPDGNGMYFSDDHKIAFGHTRLSFLDLSNGGNQPFKCNQNSVVITFNGEIYNYIELKEELKSFYNFTTHSDTEVIVAVYKKWGIQGINKLKGMFAIAIYDLQLQKVFLVRDRFGIKPLYYSLNSFGLIFGSEIKAILKSGEVDKKLNLTSFADFFVYRYIPSPNTIWDKIYKLPAAHFLELNLNTFECKLVEYWKLSNNNLTANFDFISNQTNHLLSLSVKEHYRSDVPVGSFLSGGYDSSALVLFMQQQGFHPDTFSIGFKNWENSEHRFAKLVADYLKVKLTYKLASESNLDLLNIMPVVYDEPIADISIIPTYMVSKLARQSVKAVFSGEGADEIFGGYIWHQKAIELALNKKWYSKFLPFTAKSDWVFYYAQAMSMGAFDRAELKNMLHPNLHHAIPTDVNWFYRKHYNPDIAPIKAIQYMDIKCFMGELVLTKIDRASMANSLEVRVPFLDHHLVEFIFSLKENQYLSNTQTKDLLYQNINKYLPPKILQRKKQGFVGPDSYYMNLAYYQNQLKSSKLVANGLIRKEYVDNLLKQTYNWKLWKLLIMEKWFAHWVD